jgi:hypothetical protein
MNRENREKVSNLIPPQAEIWGNYDGNDGDFKKRLAAQRKKLLKRGKASIAKKTVVDNNEQQTNNKEIN